MEVKKSGTTGPDDRLTSPARHLTAYLESRLDPLVDRSIEIAKLNGYSPFTTTIRAAWVEAILSVTESLDAYLQEGPVPAPGPQATLDYKSDPRFLRMRQIARQHRSLGITLPMYVGLFKHFRNLYVAEIDAFPGGLDRELFVRVRDFFDETELSISADWYNSDENLRLREMQERSRAITLDKDRYFAIFESLRNPAFLLDKSHGFLNANQAAAELFLGAAQAGEIIYLRSMRQRKNALQEILGQIMEAVKDPDCAVWLETLRGARCFDVRMRALHNAVDNIPIGHVVLLNDVTAHRRATEKAQRSERGMSRFLATMSHEIRTPLHSVLGATELLRTADAGAAQTYLDLIENAGQTLLQTLNNVLDYSKIANEAPTPRVTQVDVGRALQTFERVAAIRPEREQAKLTFQKAPDLPAFVLIDWAMTQQVLSNLVSNAIRADDGRGVTVSVCRLAAPTLALRFEVRDHGPGIPSEYAEALLRPFEKVRARDTGGGGAGLGLAIAHHLVQAMGGRIGYRNRDTGALVWFEVPYSVSERTPPDRADTIPARPAAGRAATRCLLIDDDPIGSTVTARQLERLGFHVERCSTVAEANAAAGKEHFDVFVVDYLLPDGDGPSLVRALRAQLPEGPRFIALTANIEALEKSDDVSSLFDRVLAKPVDQDRLHSALCPQARNKPSEPGHGRHLEGLSPETVRAMATAFEHAWKDFRRTLRPGSRGTEDLAQLAHRLAGSAAILGIDELQSPLREIERRWPDRKSEADLAPLLTTLDRDLMEVGTWISLCRSLDPP